MTTWNPLLKQPPKKMMNLSNLSNLRPKVATKFYAGTKSKHSLPESQYIMCARLLLLPQTRSTITIHACTVTELHDNDTRGKARCFPAEPCNAVLCRTGLLYLCQTNTIIPVV